MNGGCVCMKNELCDELALIPDGCGLDGLDCGDATKEYCNSDAGKSINIMF